MIDKKKLFKTLIIISLIIIIIIAVIQIRNTLARYETTTTTQKDVDVAFWVLDNSFKEQRLLINDIYPNNTPFTYTFTVSNFENDKIAETDIEYDITIITTTNLPLDYEIQRNGTTYTGVIEKLFTDSSGTVYKEIKFGTTDNPYPFVMDGIDNTTYAKKEVIDEYTLKVTFPLQTYVNGVEVNNRENPEYADLMEDVKIAISARQKIN